MISISNLGKAYGDRVLFQGATLQLNPGERYGLVGANGAGKTTFLGVLTGDVEPTEGHVSIPRRLRLGVLRQDQFLYDEESILDVTLMGNPELWEIAQERERILENAAESFDADRFSELEERFQMLDGYTAEARAGTILEGLGIAASVHRNPIRTLSGGFKLRVLLAQVLASSPDVLLLDEPTNHLDILSIRWLETFLQDFTGPVVVISHDHRFLDQTATHILDVDYETVRLYHGNYTAFLDSKALERERREKEIAGREREIADLQRFVDRFKAKASKARQAQSKARIIERKADELPELARSSRRYPTFKFVPRRESGREVLHIKGVRKAFGEKEVLHGVDLSVRRGDRLAILGPNGVGKSTLLKIIMGELAPDSGEITWGYETHPGYFAQDHKDQFEQAQGTVESWIWSACPDKDLGFVRGHLGMVLFSGDDPKKRLDGLSGGEAARLVFSRIAMDRPNVLVLDEPTNHLDLESIEALVEGLKSFEGTLILVSHDRWFVGALATRIVEIRPDRIVDYEGSYDEFVHFCGDDHLDVEKVVSKAREERAVERRNDGAGGKKTSSGSRAGNAASTTTPASGSGSPNRKRDTARRDTLTAEIEAEERRIAALDERFCAPGFYEATSADETRRLEEERARRSATLETLMAEWEDLEERLSRPG